MQPRRLSMLAFLVFVVAVLSGGPLSAAEDNVVDLSGKSFSEDDVIGALGGGDGGDPASRSILPGQSSASAPRKLSLSQITFEKGSDRLTAKATTFLDIIGRALASRSLKGRPLVIEGHTDASGSADFNMRLSKRRAESVRRYLIETHGVDPGQLSTVGKGPTDLVDKSNPQGERNRRVVVAPGGTAP